MRLLITLLIILAVVISFGVWTNQSLAASARDLTHQIDAIANEVQNNRWAGAVAKTNALKKTWGKKATWWPMILEHQEIDNIEFSLARVREYVAARSNPLARGQLSELKLMINHIPRKEELTLQNIL